MTVSFQNGSFLNGSATSGSLTLSGGVTSSSLYNTEYLEQKKAYNDEQEAIEIGYAAEDAVIESKISKVNSYLASGQEDKAMDAYNELLEEMAGQTRYSKLIDEDGDNTQLRAIARKLIEAELDCDLEDYIRENTRNAKGVEAQKILTWGNCDSTTQEELLAAMCDLDEDEGHSFIVDGLAAIASPFYCLGNLLFNGNKKVK